MVGSSKLSFALIGAGVLASALYYLPFLPDHVREGEYLAAEVIALVAMFTLIARRRPPHALAWTLIGVGMVFRALGDVCWDWLLYVSDTQPSPSIADAFYLAEYPLLLAGVLLLVRGRADRATLLDSLILGTGAAVLMWEFAVGPNLHDSSLGPLDILVAAAYPVADVALLAVVAHFALSSGLRSPMVRLLAAGLVLTFAADIVYLVLQMVDAGLDPSPVDFVYPLSMFLYTATAAHPSACDEQSVVPLDWLHQRLPRLAVLGGTSLVVPLVLAIEAASAHGWDLPVLVAAWAVLVVLVLARMEEVLIEVRRSEQRFRTIFDGSPTGTGIARGDAILDANAAVRKMLGYADKASLMAVPVSRHVDDKGRQELLAVQRARANGHLGRYVFEATAIRTDGVRFPVRATVQAIDLPDGGATVAFFDDLTEQRAAEAEIRASERRYRELFEDNPHVMWIYDLETLKFLAVNDRAVKAYGWTRDEFLEMRIADIRPPEEVPALIENVRMSSEELQSSGPWVHRHKDGKTVLVEVYSNAIVWDGRKARFVLVMDVTERVQLEGQLRQAQKMEAVGRLAGGVAHDFNNLLTAITGYARLVQGGVERTDPSFADLDQILAASDRATTLTRQLLTFSRRQVLQPKLLDLDEAVRGTVAMIRRLIGEDVQLETRFGAGGSQVWADPNQIMQVLMNLAVNSRDAMPDGGTITIETANVDVTDEYAAEHSDSVPGPHVMLSVSDTGSGMDAETRRHLFEPFFTTKPEGQGTGLGLATVYGIVQQSGGTISVETQAGRGSTFSVLLPRARQDEVTAAPSESAPAPSGGRETVLVVEDEDSVRLFVCSLLRRYGFQVLQASRPEAGIEIARSRDGRIDLLITDVVMPGANGAELAARVLEARPDIRVLFMSGYTEDAIVHHGVLDEGVAFIAKPFAPEAFINTVRRTLDGPQGSAPKAGG